MHLAVCDDNIADRKQMERLLGRESDRRLNTTGVLYVDSFGNRSAILSTPMIYDGLFMDMVEDGCNAGIPSPSFSAAPKSITGRKRTCLTTAFLWTSLSSPQS